MRALVVPTAQRVTLFPWRAPFSCRVGDVTRLNTRTVKVELEPGESKSVRVGERQYVTVRRER